MLHVFKRLLLVVVAYLAAVFIGLIAIVAFYMILSNLPGAPSYFSTMSLSPIVILVVPPVALIVYLVAVIFTCLPAAVSALISEFFRLRQVWLHGPLGALIGAAGFILASPELVGTIDGSDWADLGIVAAGGLVAGVVYWLIAGRQAGFMQPNPAPSSLQDQLQQPQKG